MEPVIQPIPEDRAQEELEELYEEVLAGFVQEPNVEGSEPVSPYSNFYNPNGPFSAGPISRESLQPATPSSVRTEGELVGGIKLQIY